jgi:hypothetical protein
MGSDRTEFGGMEILALETRPDKVVHPMFIIAMYNSRRVIDLWFRRKARDYEEGRAKESGNHF